MKKLMERIIALPIWVKVVAICLALVLITGLVTAALYLTSPGDEDDKDSKSGDTAVQTDSESEGTSEEATQTEPSDTTEPTDGQSEEDTTEKPTEKGTESTEETTENTAYTEATDPYYPIEAPTEEPTEEPTELITQLPTDPAPEPTPEPTPTPTPEPTPAPTPTPDPAKSASPSVTVCSQVGPDKMIVAGTCGVDTEYIRVTGDGVTSVDIYPDKGTQKSYFIGTVYYNKATSVSVQAKQPNKELSSVVIRNIGYDRSMRDYMTNDEYMPVFCKNSRMHFYSALLCYTLSDRVTGNLRNTAKNNITETVNAASGVGAEVIYLVVPSSAAVYPETVPDEYPAATGETVYEAFKDIAEGCGATVIYPLDTMTAHKDDGEGLKIYHNTDSHWSTYGAYWGLYDLMTYISQSYPAAKPRTVSEMGFYTKEMYAGDSVFSFPDWMGFEDLSGLRSNGMTVNTKLRELAPLYNKSLVTNTLYTIFRENNSVYIDQGNGEAATVINNVSGLPTAMVLRDSFGCTVYDMLNDRFSAVYWQDSGNYKVSSRTLNSKSPDYLIYVVSERNLLKVMTGNDNASITSLK